MFGIFSIEILIEVCLLYFKNLKDKIYWSLYFIVYN